MDSTSSPDSRVIERMVIQHYRKIRSHRQYKHCLIRVYIEANMSFVGADIIARYLHMTPGLMGNLFKIVRFDPNDQGRFGVWTTPASKEKWTVEFKRNIDAMCVVRDEDFITNTMPPQNSPLSLSEFQIHSLCEQLERYRYITDKPKGGNEESLALHVKKGSTAKSPGKKDDLIAACGIGMVCMVADCFSNSVLQEETKYLNLPLIAAVAA